MHDPLFLCPNALFILRTFLCNIINSSNISQEAFDLSVQGWSLDVPFIRWIFKLLLADKVYLIAPNPFLGGEFV